MNVVAKWRQSASEWVGSNGAYVQSIKSLKCWLFRHFTYYNSNTYSCQLESVCEWMGGKDASAYRSSLARIGQSWSEYKQVRMSLSLSLFLSLSLSLSLSLKCFFFGEDRWTKRARYIIKRAQFLLHEQIKDRWRKRAKYIVKRA